MRQFWTRFFSFFPSEVFSFIAGAVFSVSINLATLLIDRDKFSVPLLLLIIGLMAASTLAFILVSFSLKSAEEGAADKPNPKHEKLASINDRLPTLSLLLTISLIPLVIALFLVLSY